ncbi:MAG: CehA/McbA family metallohydrolase [Anaerolineae bacterium]|nr:CehA/McbA family metallohydrolase [Anaerolineae bacterium]
MDVDFRFTPTGAHDIRNLLTLTIFDPDGFRGAGHRGGNSHQVHITASAATAGYLAGPLPAGEWMIQIDTHLIMPGERLRYNLSVRARPAAEDPAVQVSTIVGSDRAMVGRVARQIPGWYRGDLHAHTCHSDAAAFTVADLVRLARSYLLDFVFLTDHNTVSGLAEMDAASSADLLTAGGMELTTFWGHALCLGTREWVDWRLRPLSGDMSRVAEATLAGGQLFVIAHPQADGDPGCTGCSWRFGDMMPGSAGAVEIWNGPWNGDSNNEFALLLFYDWLNQGLRLVATAGTDAHGPAPEGSDIRPGFNVIYAASLSERALLDALLAGHLYLSSGPELLFAAASAEGGRWMVGDTVATAATFSVLWKACPHDAEIRVIVDGRLLTVSPAQEQGDRRWDMVPDEASWVVVEVRSTDGEMLAVTNPIFLAAPGARA